MPWLYVLLCLNSSSFLPSQNQAFRSDPYLSSLDSVLPLRSFLEARYALRAWEFLYTKGPPPAFSFPRALASPSVVQIPAAPSAAGTLLYFVADCTASQGTLWARGFVLWYSLHVVELSACLQAFLEVLVEESYGWKE